MLLASLALLGGAFAAGRPAPAQGWDAVTIPGWQTGSGLPTVVRYGTAGFPKAAEPPKDPGNLFAGGAGGPAGWTSNARAPAPLTPPTPSVPGYQHVFLFYFENEDYGDIIGNVKQAPYLNSLRKDGAALSGFYAECPGARTLYVASFGAGTVTPVDTETGCPGHSLPAGYAPDAVAATSGGVYAVDGNSDQLTRLGSDQAARVGSSPAAIAVSGTTAYVVNTIDGTVTPVDVRTGKAAGPLNVGAYNYPTVITITGQTAVVIEPYGYSVELINLKTRRVFPSIAVGAFPTAVAITA